MKRSFVDCTAARMEANRLVAEAIELSATELSLAGLRIDALPAGIERLAGHLKKLDLSGCYRLSDVASVGELASLTELDLSKCAQLTNLAAFSGLAELQSLNLSECVQLTSLEPLAELTALQELSLDKCARLVNLEPLSTLTELQSLNLGKCTQLASLEALAGLPTLQRLELYKCTQITSLAPLAGLPALQSLGLSMCTQVSDLELIAGLTGLQSLDLSMCDQLTSLEPLYGLTMLQSLDLTLCYQLTNLDPLSALTGLESLALDWCGQITSLKALLLLPALQRLYLKWCDKLTNLESLSSLPALQSLDLSLWNQLTSLEPLSELRTLQSLRLSGCAQFSNLKPLAGLSALQSLDLSGCSQLANLKPLSSLSALQSLDLALCTRLTTLEPLAGLTTLQNLRLSGCDQLTSLDPIAELTALQSLRLSGCRQIISLEPLSGLTALENLKLSMCDQLTCLKPLAELAALQSLDLTGCTEIASLEPLAGLTALQTLTLRGCSQFTSLEPLAGFTELQSLDISGCEKITSLEPLSGLEELQRLSIDGLCRAGNLRPISGLNNLRDISCKGTSLDLREANYLFQGFARLYSMVADTLLGAPRELANEYVSCLPTIEHWYADLLASGPTPVREAKVFTLGNGGAGKTQIVRRLCNEAYDPKVPSTHGIVIRHFPLLEATTGKPDMFAKVWDFGGQDIYLGTHSLFLDDRAIYVLVWTPQKENEEMFYEGGVQLRNYRLHYWLDYVNSLVGAQAPVIVVQSQCDQASEIVEAPVPHEHGFQWLRRTSCSAAADGGMDELWPVLRSAARLLRERHGEVSLPTNWAAVGEALQQHQHDGIRVLSLPEFEIICQERNIGAPQATLDYLHRSGAVFHAPGVFGGQIVLDQAWALDGMYAVLHRTNVLPLLKANGGHFTREWLGALLWEEQGYCVEEQEHFMSLMLSCQVCFEVVKGHYIAPDCLPARKEAEQRIASVWRDGKADAQAELHYSFLHDGVKRGLLCALGNAAGHEAVYWRHGVCFYDTHARVTVLVECRHIEGSRAGVVAIEVLGLRAQSYIADTVKSVRQGIRIGQPPQVTISTSASTIPSAPRQAMEKNAHEEEPFAHIHPGLKPGATLPRVYVSYAWDSADPLVDRIGATLAAECDWRRDRENIRAGDWISRFMDEIGLSPCVVVIISAKYLQSEYCMRELLSIYRSSLSDRTRFLDRIVPVVLPNAGVQTLEERLQHAAYWTQRQEKIEAACAGLDIRARGDATRHTMIMIGEFRDHIVDMLTWVADILMPRADLGNDKHVVDTVAGLVRERLVRTRQ